MKYATIDRLRAEYPVSALCRVLGVSQRSYCRHQRRQEAVQTTSQRISNETLLAHIRSAHTASRGCYGWPRIWAQLRRQGVRVGVGGRHRLGESWLYLVSVIQPCVPLRA